jgi:hypothetical protein
MLVRPVNHLGLKRLCGDGRAVQKPDKATGRNSTTIRRDTDSVAYVEHLSGTWAGDGLPVD